jgi:threonine/homoserine/homoserine lactone efflux protein
MNPGLVASSFALGATLGLLPGPVQLVLLTEATRGGARRGYAAMAGANGTLGILLLGLAGGLALAPPGPAALRVLRLVGGLFLLFMAAEAFRASFRTEEGESHPRGRTPVLRGMFSVLLNPGLWIFLATTASALFASAEKTGGRPLALSSAVAMVAGVACIDGTMVLLGHGARRFERVVTKFLTPVLAVGLALFGLLLVSQGVRG